MTELITATQAIEALRAVVAEAGPDHIYRIPQGARTCRYVEQTDGLPVPSCGVAKVLHRLGVPLEELSKWEGVSTDTMQWPTGDRMVPVEAQARGVTQLLTAGAATVLQAFQSKQDVNHSWGVALEWAEFEYAQLTEGDRK